MAVSVVQQKWQLVRPTCDSLKRKQTKNSVLRRIRSKRMKRRHVFVSNARIHLKSNLFIVLKIVIVLLASVVCVYKLGSACLEYTGGGMCLMPMHTSACQTKQTHLTYHQTFYVLRQMLSSYCGCSSRPSSQTPACSAGWVYPPSRMCSRCIPEDRHAGAHLRETDE